MLTTKLQKDACHRNGGGGVVVVVVVHVIELDGGARGFQTQAYMYIV